jgi:hypothetical protein
MRTTGRLVVRWALATLAAACLAILMTASFNWAMTEGFYLHPSPHEALAASGFVLAGCAIGSLVLLPILILANRFRPLGRWAAAALGGALFWAVPAALRGHLAAMLSLVPLGMVAGLVLRDPLAGRPIRLPLWLALASGIALWLFLVAGPIIEERADRQWDRLPPNASPLGNRVMGGAMLGSELWLFNQEGKAVSFHLPDWKPTVRAPSGVAALTAQGPWALLAPPVDWRSEHQPPGRFRLASWSGGRWLYSPWQSYGADERPLALAIGPQGPVVLGANRLYLLPGIAGPFRTIALSRPLGLDGQFVASIVGAGTMYVGINEGEFGGGLGRIDLKTGAVEPVEKRERGDSCGGLLDGRCDPITGLVPDPDRPGCVFASIGLSHMAAHGRVLRVCGSSVELVFEAPILPIGKRIERFFSSRARAGRLLGGDFAGDLPMGAWRGPPPHFPEPREKAGPRRLHRRRRPRPPDHRRECRLLVERLHPAGLREPLRGLHKEAAGRKATLRKPRPVHSR